MSFRDPNPVTTTPGPFSDPAGFAMNTRIMLTAVIIILFFVVLMVSLHLYSRCYLHRSRRFHIRRLNRSRRAAAAMTFFSDPSSSSTSAVTAARGLDPSVVKSLPTFIFSAATASEAVECAVCLSEFEESEPGRVLPSCKHAFHVECIDMWFHSHSSCPLCRSLVVEAFAGGVKSAAEEEVVISISGDDTNDVVEAETSETSGRGKPAASEVSRRNLGESENELTRSHSFKSRVVSSTWIFSKERRSASSSSSPTIGCPLDIESGGEETR